MTMEIRSFQWDEESIDHIANHHVSPDGVGGSGF